MTASSQALETGLSPQAIAARKPRPFALARRTIITPILLTLILLVIAYGTTMIGSKPFNQVIIDVFVRVILVVGLYVFIGNSGVMSFGQIGFTCLGAYVAAWLTINPVMKKMSLPGLPGFIMQAKMPFWEAAIIAAVFGGVAALIFGKVLMRLSGIAASIATFAMLAMINTIYSNWDTVTGATSSVVGIPIALRAARDEPTAAAASGIDIPKERLVAFVVSGAIMGAGGALTAHSIGVVTPDNFYLSLTFVTLSMLVVGGMGSLTGSVLGVVILSALIQALRSMEAGVQLGDTMLALPKGLQEIALGIIMIVILALRPAGLFGNRELTLTRNRSE
jgi:branched-chain amino acid transport system permease protein